MDKVKEALDRLEKARKEHSKHWQISLDKDSWEECQKYLEPYQRELSNASREYRLIKPPVMTPIDYDYGDRMSMGTFISCCKGGGFIDYDGFGRYIKGNEESDIDVYPSDITSGKYRKDFDEVMWFNR